MLDRGTDSSGEVVLVEEWEEVDEQEYAGLDGANDGPGGEEGYRAQPHDEHAVDCEGGFVITLEAEGEQSAGSRPCSSGSRPAFVACQMLHGMLMACCCLRPLPTT
jgi:hypothetical protein